MTRSFQFCLVLCAFLFLGEFVLEQQLATNSTVGSFLGPLSAQSEEEEEPEDPRPERKVKPLTMDFFPLMKKFSEAYEEEEDIEKAREALDRMLERARRWNEPEMAYIHQRYATVGFELEDMDLAVEHLKQILEYREHIQYVIEEQTLWQLAQIYTSEYEDFDTALDYVQQWLDLRLDWEEGARAYAFIANIHSRKEDWLQSLHWMKQAIAKAEESDLEIGENWWRLLLQSYSSLAEEARENSNLADEEKYLHEALDLTQFLVYEYIENGEYWTILSQMYLRLATSDAIEIEEQEEFAKDSVYSLESAYWFNLLEKESDFTRLVRRVAGQEAYVRAAWIFQVAFDSELVEKNFDNLKRFGQYWHQSQDIQKAIEAYEEAVTFKDDAKVLYLLATLYQNSEAYDKCVSFADRALNATEGELSQPQSVTFLKGVCQFLDDDLVGSEETLVALGEEIGPDPEEDRLRSLSQSIESYQKFIENERSRIEYANNVENAWKEYNAQKASQN